MTEFFPEPDQPYAPEDFRAFSGIGATLTRVLSSPQEFIFVALFPHEGKDFMYRFALPRHARLVREFFKRAKAPQIPTARQSFNVQGMFLVEIEGVIVGQDDIPEASTGPKPEAAYVLNSVTARVVG